MIGLLLVGTAFGQQVSFETLLEDKISIRAIELWEGKVWYAGSQSKFGYVEINNPENQKQVFLDDENKEYRTIAMYPKQVFTTVNIGSPAQFMGVSYELKPSKLDAYDQTEAFFDSYKVSAEHISSIAISDPLEDGTPLFRITSKKLNDRSNANLPTYIKGEAHFAASNTNIALKDDLVWIASGGMQSRIFKFNWATPYQWEVYETPFDKGNETTGIYSIDFYNTEIGIAVGGDYKKQSNNINNIATTNDGGKTWQTQASGKNAGYMTCVKYRPNSNGKDILAVGDQHISLSRDFGKTWKKLADQKNLYTLDWVDEENVVLAGKDRILKMKINF